MIHELNNEIVINKKFIYCTKHLTFTNQMLLSLTSMSFNWKKKLELERGM